MLGTPQMRILFYVVVSDFSVVRQLAVLPYTAELADLSLFARLHYLVGLGGWY